MTVNTDNTFDFKQLAKKYDTKLQIPINELDLTDLQKDALTHLQIKSILNLFQQNWTADLLDAECVPTVAEDLNRNLECLNIPQLGITQPSGILYSFYEPRLRRKLLNVHEKAVEILLYVHWGIISSAKMASELTFPKRNVAMDESDINLIINVSLFILELDAGKQINIHSLRAIIDAYPNIKSDISNLTGLTQGQIDALERQRLHCVYHLYEYQMTCTRVNKECVVLSGRQERSLATAVNSEIKRLGLPEIVKSGDAPVGPFYALYRALRSHSIPGAVDPVFN